MLETPNGKYCTADDMYQTACTALELLNLYSASKTSLKSEPFRHQLRRLKTNSSKRQLREAKRDELVASVSKAIDSVRNEHLRGMLRRMTAPNPAERPTCTEVFDGLKDHITKDRTWPTDLKQIGKVDVELKIPSSPLIQDTPWPTSLKETEKADTESVEDDSAESNLPPITSWSWMPWL
jgi:serine/threonine protein kinase